MTPSIYINLEDNVAAIAARIKRQRAEQVVLVCPKHCFLFSDPINLKLLKTELDASGKQAFILTMDEKGRGYAQAAGFGLRQVPGAPKQSAISDISLPANRPAETVLAAAPVEPAEQQKPNLLAGAAQELKNFTRLFSKKEEPAEPEELPPVMAPRVNVVNRQPPALAAETDFFAGARPPEGPPDAEIKDTIFPKELEEKIQTQRQNKAVWRWVASLLALTVMLALAVVFVVLPKATVAVYPQTEAVSRDLEISLNASSSVAQRDPLLLPAIRVSRSFNSQDSFQSQGKQEVGNKASGTVRIYNFTKLPINLKSQTTTLTLSGKNYRLVDDLISIKPTKYSNPATKEVNPASLSDPVSIEAAEGGESYNLPAGTRLEISNQVFGSKPQQLYAKTESQIAGGVSRYLSVVTDQDISGAQTALKQNILAQLRSSLAARGLTVLDNGYTVAVNSFSTDKPANTQSPAFSAVMQASVSALAFNANDLSALIFKHIGQSIAGDKVLQADPIPPDSYKIRSFDFAAGAAVIAAHFSGVAVSKVDVAGLPGQLVGRTPVEVNDILTSKPEIKRIDVTLAPSWQKTFPWFKQKIEVDLKN